MQTETRLLIPFDPEKLLDEDTDRHRTIFGEASSCRCLCVKRQCVLPRQPPKHTA